MDFVPLGLLSADSSPMIAEMFASTEPFRETAKIDSMYVRIGTPLFVSIRGTVDIRLRFHKTENDFLVGTSPVGLLGTQYVMLENLTIKNTNTSNKAISLLIDENDLNSLKRFVTHMERELELSKNFLKERERKGNG